MERLALALPGVELIVGAVLILAIFYDLFQSVVLPRPAIGKVQLARVIVRPMWRLWRWVSRRTSRLERSEAMLGAFAPVALLSLFGIWGIGLIVGYGLIVDGLAIQFHPVPPDTLASIYVSATTLVPLSYGDVVPVGAAARIAIIVESGTGVGIAALAITLLFSLYGSFQKREELVIELDALAGAPPSGLQILETVAGSGQSDALKEIFDQWRSWSAMVLESHLAYPLLVYFRSSHDNEAWINSFGAVLDAAVLVMSTVETNATLPARLMFTVGNHLVEDLTWLFRMSNSSEPIVERDEYDKAIDRLTAAGYTSAAADVGWKQFAELRAKYASPLNEMAHLLAIVPAQWIGDRSYLPHRQRRSPRSPRARARA